MLSPVKIWRNQKHIKGILGKTGTILAFTIIRVPLSGFENQAPYPVVMVKSRDKTYFGQLVDSDINRIKIGQKVVAVIRRVREPHPEGIIPYGIKFKTI